MCSDLQLVSQVLDGQSEAYASLVERYERLARAAALHVVRDPHLAEDVAQEAFIAGFESLASLDDGSRFGAWLLGIVRRRAARVVRTRHRSPVVVGNVESTAIEDEKQPSFASMELLEFVERLPAHERVVVGLRHFNGYSVEEIAALTARPLGTITKQLSRAHQRLRQWLTLEEL